MLAGNNNINLSEKEREGERKNEERETDSERKTKQKKKERPFTYQVLDQGSCLRCPFIVCICSCTLSTQDLRAIQIKPTESRNKEATSQNQRKGCAISLRAERNETKGESDMKRKNMKNKLSSFTVSRHAPKPTLKSLTKV